MFDTFLKWLYSSSGMSTIALVCSFLVLFSTFLSSKFKDKEMDIEKTNYQNKLNEKQDEIISLQNRIITEVKAPYFELKAGELLSNGKFEIKFKNISNIHIRTIVFLLTGTYAIKDEKDLKTTPYLRTMETFEYKVTAADSFSTLDPSEERIIQVDLFPDNELIKMEKMFGNNSIVLYNLDISPIVDSYSVKIDESLKNRGIPHIGISSRIINYKNGGKSDIITYINRPELEYHSENIIPPDAIYIMSTRK